MKRHFLGAALPLLAIGAGLLWLEQVRRESAARAEPRIESVDGRAIRVIDGDTVRLPSGEVIRIHNIDAPETARARCDAEAALGERAADRLRQLLRAGPVAIILDDPTGRRADRYGRTLARLTVAGRDGRAQDVGETMIAAGLATRWPQRRDWCGRG